MNESRIAAAIGELECAREDVHGLADDLIAEIRETAGRLLAEFGSDTGGETRLGVRVGELATRARGDVVSWRDQVGAIIECQLEWADRIREREEALAAQGVGAPIASVHERTPSAGAAPGRTTVPPVLAVEPDELTQLFNAYADASTDATRWTGADSTYSVELPNKQIVWIFSDTLVGPVYPDGTRPALVEGGELHMPANTFVVQDGTSLSTVMGKRTVRGHDGPLPASLVAPFGARHPKDLYWAGDAQLCDGQIEVVYRRYVDSDFAGICAVVRFDPAALDAPADQVELPDESPVAWGSAVRRAQGYTYVYGSEDTPSGKYLQIARVPGDSMIGRWEYYAGDGRWSPDLNASTRQLHGVANEFSVTPLDGGYLLLTHDTTTPLSPDIVGYMGPTPYGPFEDKTVLYTTPETGVDGTYGSPRVYTHNAHAHLRVDRDPGELLVSYNVHAWPLPDEAKDANNDELLGDVSVFRPRFVTIRFAS